MAASEGAATAATRANYPFYAVYERFADSDTHGLYITASALSGNGQRLIFAGSDAQGPVVYTADVPRANLTRVPLPPGATAVPEVAINRDGSRAFFNVRGPDDLAVFKVERGVAARVFGPADNRDIGATNELQPTADGATVYFRDGRNRDVWRVGHDGSGLQKVIEDTDVSVEGKPGAYVQMFAVSDDGSRMAFVLAGFWDEKTSIFDTGFRSNEDLFLKDGAGYRQLTRDEAAQAFPRAVGVSGDGSRVSYANSTNGWRTLDPVTGASTNLTTPAGNWGAPQFTRDGSQLFYSQGGVGKLIASDGSRSFDLFPAYNVNTLALAANLGLSVSDDGRRVAFIFEYASLPSKRALYAGQLNPTEAWPDVPAVDSVDFDPPVAPRVADQPVILTTRLSDPQGLSDIDRTSLSEVLDGRALGTVYDVPIVFGFPFVPLDNGQAPDPTAGDGAFTAGGKTSKTVDQVSQVTVRVAAADKRGSIAVADVVLGIGAAPPEPGDSTTRPIDDGGGEVSVRGGDTQDGGVTVVLPPSTVSGTVNVTVTVLDEAAPVSPPGGSVLIPKSLDVTLDRQTTLRSVARIRINLTVTDLGGRGVGALRGGVIVGNQIVPLPTRVVDASQGVISIDVDHFTKFTLFAVTDTSVTLTAPADQVTLGDFQPVLTWINPPGTTQFQLQVAPFNNDGPGVNLIRNADSSFPLPAPPDWYGLLPDMSYFWRVRTTTVTTFPTEADWTGWTSRTFKTPAVGSGTITAVSPAPGSAVAGPTPTVQWANTRNDVFYYEVQLSKDAAFNTDPATATAMVYSALIHGGVSDPPNSYAVPPTYPLEPGTTYTWRVRPRVQGDGTPAAWSAVFTFKTG